MPTVDLSTFTDIEVDAYGDMVWTGDLVGSGTGSGTSGAEITGLLDVSSLSPFAVLTDARFHCTASGAVEFPLVARVDVGNAGAVNYLTLGEADVSAWGPLTDDAGIAGDDTVADLAALRIGIAVRSLQDE